METTPPRMGDEGDETAARELLDTLGSERVGTLAPEQFRESAKAWASYCLDNFTGKVLERGMAVATALAEYATELEAPHG